MSRPRMYGTVAAVAALLLALAAPAAAQADAYVATATGNGFAVTLPQSPVGDVLGGTAEAHVSDAPLAAATGVGFALVDDSTSEASVEGEDGSASDGENCGSAGLPEEIGRLLSLACSTSTAEISGGLPAAAAEASGLELALTGADVQVLLDTILAGLEEAAVGEALTQAEQAVLSPLRAALAEACLAGSSELQPVFDGAGELLAEVERNLEENLPLDVTTLDPTDPCLVLLDLTGNPPIIGAPADVIDTLRAAFAAALADAVVVAATLGAGTGDAEATSSAVAATATAVGVDVSLPALDLAGTLVGALTELVDQFLAEVGERIVDVEFEEPALPSTSELVAMLRDALPDEVDALLSDTEPLVTVVGGLSEADVSLDVAGDATAEGGQAPLQVTLSSAFEAFLEALLGGQDVTNPITIPEGDSVTIAEGTPLESTFAVGSVRIEDVEEDGLTGQRVTASGVDIQLLAGLDGGIGLAVAGATAEALGAAVPVEAAPDLPSTGGGLVLLGLLSLGAAVGLRRR